ncbi:MAG: cytochrome biosis protein [Verrucomicrobia bacterium]|jgi:ABC-type transport system involved in cytochrome c biogenesis permease subunit|nr:cytochrome biosis protein [Verrucomicrobiota bacterium]
MRKIFSLILFAILALLSAPVAQAESLDFKSFGKLPVSFNGRFQPLDSLARNSLLQIREKQSLYLKEEKRTMPAIEWLAEVMMNPEKADGRKVFRIDHPDVVSMLKLPEKNEAAGEDGKHYSWNQILPNQDALSGFDAEQKRIVKIEASHRNPFERAIMKLHERLVLYMRLKSTLQPPDAKDWAAEVANYKALIEPGVAAVRAQQAGRQYDEDAFDRFVNYAQRFDVMNRFEAPLVVPPHHPEVPKDEWMRMGEALLEAARGEKMHSSVEFYGSIVSAYRKGEPALFNQKIGEYSASLKPEFTKQLKKANAEHFYNSFQAFYRAMVLYVIAFLLACFSWFNMSKWLRISAFWLIFTGLIIHTAGLIFRMWLEGRPPVTNLYSSAIFIGWGAVILGLILERFYKDGIGSVVASMIGFITLVVAHNLSLGGDTMVMMQAVLDTNFWLATHVVIITLGYASTFVAGFLAIVYLARGVFTNGLTDALSKALSRMVYGIVCFATLFSFVGTVLGGIWADQSWGRFWGWDPKENGALIIVLWNALILHARWGGMVKERGIMNMAIFGNIVTAWSWFGTNMLGIGLHSYGFMDSAFKWLMVFMVSQLALIGLGLLPIKFWGSAKNLSKGDDEPPVKPGKNDKGAKKADGKLATA